MEKKTWFSRVISMICIVAVIASTLVVPVELQASTASDYKVIGPNYIAGADAEGTFANETGWTAKRLVNIADDKITSLNGVLFDGVYNFAAGAAFGIGGHCNGGAHRLQMQVVNSGGVTSFRYQLVGDSSTVVNLTADDLGGEFVGKDLRIKTAFSLSNVDATTKKADVTVRIQIGNSYEGTITGHNISIADTFENAGGVIVGPAGAITIKVPTEGPSPEYKEDSEYTIVKASDFTGQDTLVLTGEEKGMRPSTVDTAGTMDGLLIDGIYKFEGTPAINLGGRYNGFQMNIVDKSGKKYLRYQMVGATTGSKDVCAEDVGCEIYGEDVRIKVGFTFTNVNAEAGTADVEVQISIGDIYKDIYKATNYAVNTRLARIMMADARSAGSTLTIKKPETQSGGGTGGEEPSPEYKEDSEYTIVKASDFTGQDTLVLTGEEKGMRPSTVDTAGTMGGLLIDGIYKFEGTPAINLGGRYNGFQMNIVDKSGKKYLRYQMIGATTGSKDVCAEDVGCEIYGEDVRIKVGFTFTNVNAEAGTADVEVQISIGDIYKDIYKATNYAVNTRLARIMMADARAAGSTLTIKNPSAPAPDYKEDSEYTIVPAQSFTGQDELVVANQEKGMRPSTVDQAGTLDGILIDGIYKFDGAPVLNMGGRQNGLQFNIIEKSGKKYLRYQLVGSGVAEDVSAEDVGCAIFGEDVRIKAGFTFSNVNEETGVADVEVQISIGDSYKDIYKVEAYQGAATRLGRILFADARGTTNTLTIKKVEVQSGGGTGGEEPGPEFKDESEYTLVAVQDFTGDVEYVVTGTEAGMRPSSVATAGTLDRLLIDGIYKFEGSPVLNMGGRQNGLQFQIIENSGVKYLCYQLVGSTAGRRDISAAMAGCEIYGEDVRIKAGFTFSNINEETGTADVEVQISIGDTYKDIYKATAYPSAELRLGRVLFVDARTAGSTLTLKEIEKPEKELPPLPADSDYTWINFSDYGITKEYVTEDTETGLRAGTGTYDGYMVEGVFNFKGAATVNFGGKYNGLQINLVDKGGKKFLRYQLVGSGMSTDVSASKAGTKLEGTDLALKVGFSFDNVNQDAGTADVTVQIRIGDTYKDAFTVQGYQMEKLHRILFIDARGEDCAVIMRKPYMEPVDFTEFGFTENYEKELNIIFKKKAVVMYKAENRDNEEKENEVS